MLNDTEKSIILTLMEEFELKVEPHARALAFKRMCAYINVLIYRYGSEMEEFNRGQ